MLTIREKFDILSDDILERLTFGTTAMHAYGHQWACQLVYNPRIREGLGLSDGEGTERLWSKLRKLISITRQMAVRTFRRDCPFLTNLPEIPPHLDAGQANNIHWCRDERRSRKLDR